MIQHSLATFVALSALLAAPAKAHPSSGDPEQNFLILLADDLGVDLVGTYGIGNDVPPTPTLDKLATKGVTFLNAWSYTRCSPSRATLQSGRFGFHTGVGTGVVDLPGNYGLPLEETLLPELLDATHTSGCFGKWHLQSPAVGGALAPNLQGYDHYSGALNIIRKEEEYFLFEKTTNGVPEMVDEYILTHTIDDALTWIDQQEGPWLCSLNLHVPHAPTHTPPAELHSFGTDLPDERTKYKAAVEAMDTELGRMLFELGGEVLANTTVIFMGDNGSEPALSPPPINQANGKGTLYEPGIRVPMIVVGPDVAQPGREILGVTCITDVWSTLAEIVGVDTTGLPTDSISFLPHLDGSALQGAPVREYGFVEQFIPNGIGPNPNAFRAIRDQRFKVHRTPTGDEFYDLKLDPLEKNDLLDTGTPLLPAFEAIYQGLVAELEAILAS